MSNASPDVRILKVSGFKLSLINHQFIKFTSMSNKTRSVIKAIAVILVLLCVIMQMGWVIIPAISPYKFWIVVLAFGTLLITSK